MTIKELRELINSLPTEYDNNPVLYLDTEYGMEEPNVDLWWVYKRTKTKWDWCSEEKRDKTKTLVIW